MMRPLSASDEKDVQFEKGKVIPMAFNVWDGGNGEHGLIMSLSPRYYVYLAVPIPILTYLFSLLGTVGMGIVLVRIHLRYHPAQGAARRWKLRGPPKEQP